MSGNCEKAPTILTPEEFPENGDSVQLLLSGLNAS
jgi:hypothetical protein